MISGYIGFGRPEESRRTFKRMVEYGIDPNAFTLSFSIKACAVLGALKLGRCLHGVVFLRGFASNEVIVHSLSASNEALQSFEEMAEPDSVSWRTSSGQVKRWRNYFRSMREDYKIERGLKHYNCMVGLLARAGMIDEAEELINGKALQGESFILIHHEFFEGCK
ncbi:Pentatricopeptide repeat-containing protein [Acorus calamus]|uniref:Pentatricopeptide repeat-containing protein n=1 Tax=Acorus calamus TaxID=4465 RepID=A0AAV9FFG6_ACOCL|nr:Pentatricopeptide repeat-containing protein [Acorus calamus]